MDDYFRQNQNRHKAEKMLDKFILKEEKKEVKQLEDKLIHWERINEVKLSQKRKREEIDKSNNINQSESEKKLLTMKEKIKKINQEKEQNKKTNIENEQKEKEINIDIESSVDKILKHCFNKSKYTKCLELLRNLVFSNFVKIPNNLIIKIFYIIFRLIPHKFIDTQDIKILKEIFEFADKNIKEKLLFENEESQIWESLSIPILYQIKVITDDSFNFNNVLKQIESLYNKLDDYDEKEKEIIEIFDKINEIQKYTELKQNEVEDNKELLFNKFFSNLPEFVKALKRDFIFDCLKQVFSMNIHSWANGSIKVLFKKIYLNKNKFSKTTNKEIEEMINILNNNISSLSLLDKKRGFADEKIKNNPLESYYKVTDARTEIARVGENDTWAAKQNGLTWSKLTMN